MVVGTFLPWLRSGSVLRDSYEAIGLGRFYRLVDSGWFELALDAWVAITPIVTLCAIGYGFGFRRSAAGLCGGLALVTGTVSGVAAVQAGNGGALLGVASTGPVVTLTGSVLAVLGAAGVFAGQRTSATKTTGGEP